MKVDKNYQLVKSELLLKAGVDSLLSGLILKVIRVKDTKKYFGRMANRGGSVQK